MIFYVLRGEKSSFFIAGQIKNFFTPKCIFNQVNKSCGNVVNKRYVFGNLAIEKYHSLADSSGSISSLFCNRGKIYAEFCNNSLRKCYVFHHSFQVHLESDFAL